MGAPRRTPVRRDVAIAAFTVRMHGPSSGRPCMVRCPHVVATSSVGNQGRWGMTPMFGLLEYLLCAAQYVAMICLSRSARATEGTPGMVRCTRCPCAVAFCQAEACMDRPPCLGESEASLVRSGERGIRLSVSLVQWVWKANPSMVRCPCGGSGLSLEITLSLPSVLLFFASSGAGAALLDAPHIRWLSPSGCGSFGWVVAK